MVITKQGGEYKQDGFEVLRFQDFSVTIGPETRTVKGSKGATEGDVTRWFLSSQFAAKVGRSGGKAHRVGIMVEETGGKLRGFENTVVLNRTAWVTGFWHAAYDAPQGYGSKHIGTHRK